MQNSLFILFSYALGAISNVQKKIKTQNGSSNGNALSVGLV